MNKESFSICVFYKLPINYRLLFQEASCLLVCYSQTEIPLTLMMTDNKQKYRIFKIFGNLFILLRSSFTNPLMSLHCCFKNRSFPSQTFWRLSQIKQSLINATVKTAVVVLFKPNLALWQSLQICVVVWEFQSTGECKCVFVFPSTVCLHFGKSWLCFNSRNEA